MRSQFFKGLCFSTVMLILVTGCGKDSQSGGSSSGSSSTTSSVSVPTGSQAAWNNLKKWYSSSIEGTPTTSGTYTEYRKTVSYNDDASDDCDTKSYLWGFINVDLCFSSNTGTDGSTTSKTVFVYGQSKSSNSNLAAVFTTPTGYQLIQVGQQSTVYNVEYGNTSTGDVIRYKIDTAVHSAFNPVEIYDSSTMEKEYLYSIR